MEKTIKETKICEEAESLKDILWYIKGMSEQSKKDFSNPLFNEEHINALELAIYYLITK